MTDDDLRRALSELPDPRPRDDWQARVHRRTMTRELERPATPRWLMATAAGLVAAVVVLGLFLRQQEHDFAERERALMREKQSAEVEARRNVRAAEELKLQIDQIQAEQEDLERRLAAATTDAERDRIRRELGEKKSRLMNLRNKGSRPALMDSGVKVSCDPNDPLCGVK